MTVKLLHGDCRQVLDMLPECSVQCCVSSPPYWGLRSYLPEDHPSKRLEIGSEPTVDEWVATMVDVFRRVRRVLRDDGVLFLNLGDSYHGGGRGGDSGSSTMHSPQTASSRHQGFTASQRNASSAAGRAKSVVGLKPKDLIGQPWLAAFALRADGWWLRQELIWAKNNPMPESARDRCTKSHEHIFLLSKSANYFWNFDAVQEPVNGGAHARRCITAGTREGDTVLDPFGGSGTVGLVADGMQRHAILIDIDERNLPMARDRIAGDAPLFAEVTTA
jgi:DNA modification methylase